MTYALLTLPFIAVTLAVALVSAVRPRFAQRMAASALAAVALVLLTAVFDNVMIAARLFSYPPEHLTGIRIGLAPIEDFAYPLCAAFLVPALFALLRPRVRA
jgi:lycopene cyclase domain-containing protein